MAEGSDCKQGKRILIACMMVEDEVKAAVSKLEEPLPIVWVDRGFHEFPSTLKAELQRQIDAAEEQGFSEIMLAFGLCGLGVVGLEAQKATIIIPRFDDCINFMLCPECRKKRGYARAGVMYVTKGWNETAVSVKESREMYIEKYGERRARHIIDAMWAGYRAVAVIDNGAYDLDEVIGDAKENADELGVEFRIDPGYNYVLERLVSGDWDSPDFVKVAPGQPVEQEFFDWVKPRSS